MLLAIGQTHEQIVKYLFDNVKGFHKLNCLSKPYSVDHQKDIVFHQEKRIKREVFSLKLTILNRDEPLFQLLWNENILLWNLGHLIFCLTYMIKSNWESGLTLLFNSATSKVIFMSINDPYKFVDAIAKLNKEVQKCLKVNPNLTKKVKQIFCTNPYFMICYFLELASNAPDLSYMNLCAEQIQEDDI